MRMHKESEVLCAEGKSGKKFWQGFILVEGKNFYHQSKAWHITATGATSSPTSSEPYLVKPKNVGKANETSPQEQAELEFDAILKKQQDKGYMRKGQVNTGPILPMLAQKFKERAHKLTWPVIAQPKLNGMRMLTDGVRAWSRGGKDIPAEVVAHILPGKKLSHIVDGELILPNNVLLQETMRAAKKFRPGVSDKLQFHTYDVIADSNFNIRYGILAKQLYKEFSNAVLVESIICADSAAVMRVHAKFTKARYEGTMIRDFSEGYKVNQRSNQLQKLKDFTDTEFKILNVVEGGGSDLGCAIFICDNGEGKEFRCRPEGDKASTREMYQNRSKLIGKWLTVRFQELSEDNIPIFPIGEAIRDAGTF